MAMDKKQENISGRTYVKHEKIMWHSGDELVSEIPIKDIRIIGEYTTNDGPLVDDWFFVFVLNSDDIRQVSAYATGIEEMLRQVGQLIRVELTGQLANSAKWKTNVLWPTSFRGQELFELTDKKVDLTDTLKKYLGCRASA